MRKFLMLLGAVSLAMPAGAHLASAQDYGDRRGEHFGSPTGSFVESCKDTQQRGWTVSAICKDREGRWSRTSTNFRSCPGFELENINGNLVCAR